MNDFIPQFKKYRFVAVFSAVCVIAGAMFGCGDDDKDDTKCDCATGANCTDDEKAKCTNEDEKKCNCATGTNCTEDEKAACASIPQLCVGDECVVLMPGELLLDVITANSSTYEHKDSHVDYLVKLSKKPTSEVKIAINISNTSEISSETQELVFTPDNWKEGQTVRFNAVIDNVKDDDKEVNILFTCTSSDLSFNEVSKAITIINKNADAAKIIVSKPKSQIVKEGEPSDDNSYEVKLGSKPSGLVEVNLLRNNNDNILDFASETGSLYDYSTCTFSPSTTSASLIFNEDNWNIPQKVTVSRADDDYAYKPFTRTFTVRTADSAPQCNSEGQSAPLMDPEFFYKEDRPELSVDIDYTIVDNDSKELFVVSRTSGGKVVTYDDDSVKQVCINPPDNDMTITMTVDTDDVKVLTASKDVTSACAKEYVSDPSLCGYCFDLQGLSDDGVPDEDKDYHITFTSSDSLYEPLVIDAVNRNHDIPKLVVGSPKTTLNEGESADLFFYLTAKPSSPVSLEFGQKHSDRILYDKNEYKFTSENWRDPLKVRVTARVTEKEFDSVSFSETLTTSSSDPKFDPNSLLDAKQTRVQFDIVDNTKESIQIEGEFAQGLTEGQKTYIWIRRHYADIDKNEPITVQGCNRVTLTADTDEYDNVKNMGSTVSFNTGKSDIYLTVKANDNTYNDGDEKCSITLEDYGNASKTHAMYDTFYFTVFDNEGSDQAPVKLDCPDAFDDNGSSQHMTCYVSLIGQEPTDLVTVNFSVDDMEGFTFSPAKLDFDSSKKRALLPVDIAYEPHKNTKLESMTSAYANAELKAKSSGPGVYNNYTATKQLSFLSQGTLMYDTKDMGSGEVTLLPGTYELIVEGALGAGPHQWRTRGGGAFGTFAKGKLKLTEKTKVFVHYGIAGYPRQLELNFGTYIGDNDYIGCPSKYNCGGKGAFAHLITRFAGDGGGATDIRIGVDDLEHRVIVAAGGNGAGNNLCDHDATEKAEASGDDKSLAALAQKSADDWKDYAKEQGMHEAELIITGVFSDDPEWCFGDTPSWQAASNAASSPAENARDFKDSSEFGVYWVNPFDPANGKGGGAGGWVGGKVRKHCEGARGGSGFVWTDGVTVPSASFKLDKKYQLTDVKGWDSKSTDTRQELGCWIKKGAEGAAADGRAVIRVIPE